MGRYNFNQRTRDGYEISPEQAAKWLERNDNNRNVNVAKVKKMAKDMREGHWDTTHQGTELVLETRLYIYNAERGGYYVTYSANRDFMTEVTNEELKRYPEELRPQLTGKLMKIDISEPSYKELLQNYAGYKNAKNDSTKMFYYNMFRQGLDILDLDDFTYQMLEVNNPA